MKNFQHLSPADYLGILRRRKWYSLAAFLLTGIGVGLYAWRIPDVYQSEARVLIQSTIISQDYVRPADNVAPETRIAAPREQVLGRTFIEGIIQELQMFGYPSNQFSMDEAVSSLRNSTQVVSTSKDTFTLSFASTDPQLAQRYVSRVLEKLRQAGNSARQTRAVDADRFLDDQLRDTESKLRAQEEKIKQFKNAHLGELPQQATANMNALSQLNTQLASVENALQQGRDQGKLMELRAKEQKQLDILTSDLMSPAPDQLTAPTSTEQTNPQLASLHKSKQAELAALRIKYMPAHPDVERVSREVEAIKRQIEAAAQSEPSTDALTLLGEGESKPVSQGDAAVSNTDAMMGIGMMELQLEAEALNQELAKREKEKRDILGQIKAYQARLNQGPTIEQELAALSLEYDIIRQQYTNLQTKKYQAEMTYSLESDGKNDIFRVIDEPNLPERPVFPNRIQIASMGLLGALLFGIGAAFGREMLDSTLGSETEVVSALSIPVLASISEIPRKVPKRLASVKIRHLGKTA
jgi:succinoglycan biosynthesis transport protein ExoP